MRWHCPSPKMAVVQAKSPSQCTLNLPWEESKPICATLNTKQIRCQVFGSWIVQVYLYDTEHFISLCVGRRRKVEHRWTQFFYAMFGVNRRSVQKNGSDTILKRAIVPFTASGFGNWFRDMYNEVGLQHSSALRQRKACAKRLANAGCTPEQIIAITGHKTLSEVAYYTRDADQERNARPALAKLLMSESGQVCST
jgi:Phage integrase family